VRADTQRRLLTLGSVCCGWLGLLTVGSGEWPGLHSMDGEDDDAVDDDAWEVLRRVGGSGSSADAPAVVDLGNLNGASHAYSYRQLWRRCGVCFWILTSGSFFNGKHAKRAPDLRTGNRKPQGMLLK